ncbi:MAG: acyltransferase [Rudaea sp.]|uniref:acyltransferase family protein n=1 Tax=unclassified Rudaea TaxID=2627037 RepID=UPI0010F4EED1|nr:MULTISPECIES: acyltransferase [unclassified Rudaea]MBN8886622.1 acyltransferase [Rudaea sp.]MBR0344321.1 acyltransferase [Rudaea sp.]
MQPTITAPSTHERHFALDYLRAFITVLVVAHHAVLAYHPYAPPLGSFGAANMFWAAFPVVDTQRWAGIDVFVGFNDTFFMSLMFLLSGLFVWPSLRRKGAGSFLRDRCLRLGLPFVVSALVLAPLAYYPAWLQRGGEAGIGGFAQAWLALGVWPAGPAWFLWALLAFDVLAALSSRIAPGWAEAAGRALASRSPAVFFAWLAAIALIAFVPLASLVDPSAWWSFGPFFFQTCRVGLYLSFFAVGIAVGAWGIERGVFAAGGNLGRRWMLWLNVAVAAYFALVALFITLLVTNGKQQPIAGLSTATLAAFALSCTATSIALLAIFLRFKQRRSAVLDSLSRNAYGIYIVHYAFVSWLQFSLLGASWPGAAKGTIVFLAALALSWLTVATLRRSGWIARVI